jgi:hypothetical protein
VLPHTLAHYVQWHRRKALAPLLLDDEEPEAGKALRDSPVAPARRSERAECKARTRRMEDGLPAHLGPLTRTWCRPPGLGGDVEVTPISRPTPVQARAFEWLGISALA